MNRGVWLATENVVECFRDIEALSVLGGAVFDNESERIDWFLESHDVKTPVYYWKVVRGKDGGEIEKKYGTPVIAFWVPNSEDAKKQKDVDKFTVTIAELEANLAKYDEPETFEFGPKFNKSSCYRAPGKKSGCTSWVAETCDQSRR